MPKPDAATLRRRAEIVADMSIIVPGEGVVDAVNSMRAFESDGLTAYRQLPLVVVLPETVAQVSRILKYCNERNIRVVPRGSGTSLSGGALPLEDAVLLVMSRFNRILDDRFRQPRRRSPSPASPISASPPPSSRRAFITPPIHPPRSPARSAAMSRKIPAACIA